MTSLKIDFLVLLGVLEVALLLLVMALVFVFRSRKLARQVRALQGQLKTALLEPESIGFDQYLRDEVIRNQGLIDRAAISEDPVDHKTVELLRLRKQFLELELTAQEAQANPVELQNRVATGMQTLIEAMQPEPETVVSDEALTEQPLPVEEDPTQDAEPVREMLDTRNDELEHLRQVINNQQDAMKQLRARLDENCGARENVDAILRELDAFEKQGGELHHCLESLEAENQRLKAGKQAGESSDAVLQSGNTDQLADLQGMGDKQQATIANIHGLIQELAPDDPKARLLEEAMASIQHTNEELTGCVSVLEDENAMLREALGEVACLDKPDAPIQESAASEAAPMGTESHEIESELEIKVQELEALLEFKDATIEELEKQYNKLQSRYLAETGKTRTD